jgi:neutral trehalase
MIALKKNVPKVHYYNQDFVDIYVRSWNMIDECWLKGNANNGFSELFFSMPNANCISQVEACYSVFSLVYSNRVYQAHSALDNFYSKQEANGAIRSHYNLSDGKAIISSDNPEGLAPPLFAWSEFDLYHKTGAKKRIKEVLPILQKYFAFIDAVAFDEKLGLYKVPLAATAMPCMARGNVAYPIDYNTQMAIFAFYMSELGDILNDKETAFTYKKRYFMLKTQINNLMYNQDLGFYYDLDSSASHIKVKTLAAYWVLIAELANKENSERLIGYLSDTVVFGAPNPFPLLAMDEVSFSANGEHYNGAVLPEITYMIIKGLEKNNRFEFAHEVAVRHLYFILDTYHNENEETTKSRLWQAYLPFKEGPALLCNDKGQSANNEGYLVTTALITITAMIEIIVGIYISLPRKTVDWVVPVLELMGVENLSLKRNIISILTVKNSRGSWEIRLESEKLYYFTINLINIKKKTMPIPSGHCSMLLDKL